MDKTAGRRRTDLHWNVCRTVPPIFAAFYCRSDFLLLLTGMVLDALNHVRNFLVQSPVNE